MDILTDILDRVRLKGTLLFHYEFGRPWSVALPRSADAIFHYLSRGSAIIALEDGPTIEMAEGDFMFVPPFIPHLEANMSTTEELWWLACRTPENIVVNLPDIEDSLLAGYRRA